ncbi:hypothetical protein L3X38_036071 [Prunus dulcis]|uniref:Reverse transcriptase domain-containing protein n=1 Tax=Prunus dulcis TaxID=3755 RepID=A0AAD4V0S3_PRUDU|nr:hypothetical protein L3X38_036071 [Prunus dulcis]
MFIEYISRSIEVYVDDMLIKSLTTDQHINHLIEMFIILRQYKMQLNPAKCVFGVESGKFLEFRVKGKALEAYLVKA